MQQRSYRSAGASESPLLPADSATPCRPLRRWTQRQTDVLVACVESAFSQWRTRWQMRAQAEPAEAIASLPEESAESRTETGLLPQAERSLAGQDDADAGNIGWGFCERPARTELASQWIEHAVNERANALDHVHMELFGEAVPGKSGGSEDSVSVELARSAWKDWWATLGRELPLARTGLRGGPVTLADAAVPWSGAVQIQVPMGAAVLVLVLGHEQVDATLKKLANPPPEPRARHGDKALLPLCSISSALANQRIKLSAVLQGGELTIRQLQHLREGDVVRLRHPVTLPAVLISDDGRVVCEAWLAAQAERAAIQLAHHRPTQTK